MRITLVGRIDTVMEYDEDTCQARFLMEYENHIYECFGYAPGLTEGLTTCNYIFHRGNLPLEAIG